MAGEPSSVASLLARADEAWTSGDCPAAMAQFDRAAVLAEQQDDLPGRAAAVLGLARGQRFNVSPGLLPIRLHGAYAAAAAEPRLRAPLAAALARCWGYAGEPARARPFATEALRLAEREDDPALLADALDAALATHWGPDDLPRRREWALRLADAAAHLADPDRRLQAELWSLTVAWEVLDLPRMHRAMRGIELLAEESVRAEFFAASRRLPLELLRGNLAVAPFLIARAAAAAAGTVIPDATGVLHGMRGYAAWFAGDAETCAAEAAAFEAHAVDFGVAAVRAEAAIMWLGAGRPDKAAEMIGAFTADVLTALPRDSDWLLTLQCVLEAAVTLRDEPAAAAVLPLLEPYAGRSVVNAGAVMWHGVTDDPLAGAHALLGDEAAAARHRAAALATYERIGAGWWRDRLCGQLPADDSAPSGGVTAYLIQQPTGLWTVGRQGATFVLPPMRGLTHLRALLERPGTDVAAVSLVGREIVDQAGLEILDDESRLRMRAKLAELDAELAGAERAELRRERDAIAVYLAGGSGLAGRRRSTGSTAERARVAVRKAIVSALARIAEIDPELGRHLRDHLRTGLQCRYDADLDAPIEWVLGGVLTTTTVAANPCGAG